MKWTLCCGGLVGGLLALALACDALADPRRTTFGGSALECPLTSTAGCDGEPPRTITTTRPSPVPCQRDGTWTEVGADVACIGDDGLACYPQCTNYWTQSTDAGLWTPVGTPSRVRQADGSWLVGDDDAAGFEGYRGSYTGAIGETVTLTCEVRAGTSSTILLGASAAEFCGALAISADWQRVSCTKTLTVASTFGYFYPAGGGGGAVGTTYVRQCQLEKSPTPGRRCDSAASPRTCAADVHTVSTQGWPVKSVSVVLQYAPHAATIDSDAYLLWGDTGGLRIRRRTTGALTYFVEGTAFTGAVLTWTPGVHRIIRVDARPAETRVFVDGALYGTHAGSAVPGPWGASAHIGHNSGTSHAAGSIRLLSVEAP